MLVYTYVTYLRLFQCALVILVAWVKGVGRSKILNCSSGICRGEEGKKKRFPWFTFPPCLLSRFNTWKGMTRLYWHLLSQNQKWKYAVWHWYSTMKIYFKKKKSKRSKPQAFKNLVTFLNFWDLWKNFGYFLYFSKY